MAVKEKVLEIPKEYMEEEWTTNNVKIRKWTAGIKAKITDECMQMTVIPGQKNAQSIPVQGAQFQILMVLHQTVEAPWKVGDISVVSDLDPDVFDWVLTNITELNEGGIKNLDASQE